VTVVLNMAEDEDLAVNRSAVLWNQELLTVQQPWRQIFGLP